MGEGVSALWAYVPSGGASAFGLASLLGAFSTVLFGLVYVIAFETGELSFMQGAIILVIYTIVCTPFEALGLIIFGLPIALLLRPYFRSLATLPLALFLGAAAARIEFVFLDYIMWGRSVRVMNNYASLVLALFGLPPAFWFWFLYRRVLLARAALANEP